MCMAIVITKRMAVFSLIVYENVANIEQTPTLLAFGGILHHQIDYKLGR